MKSLNMEDNIVLQRQQFEFDKYGRRLHQELAAYPHLYGRHSIEPSYGHFDRPINEPNQ